MSFKYNLFSRLANFKSIKKKFRLTATVKAYSLLLPFLVCVGLFSCGNNRQENEREEMMSQEDGMMDGEGMMGNESMMQDGMMSEDMRKAMMSKGMGPEMMEDMMAIRKLLMQHEKINRRVENLENGVKTRTTSEDPEIAAAIQKHVRQMHERIKEKKPIRQMDPLFREIFDHADKIDMEIEDLENGVLVLETSEDPQVVKLIQQHAHRAVSEFVERGMQRAMQPTPLPEGYQE
jgi:uncharacterized protein YdcH (DUF465 family)